MLFNRQPAMGLRIPTHHSRVHKQLRWPSPLLGARGNDQNLSTHPPQKVQTGQLSQTIIILAHLCLLSEGPRFKSKKTTEK